MDVDMIKVTEKTQIIVEVICIVLLLGLCAVIYLHGRSLECNKCIATFKQERMFGIQLQEPKIFQFKVIDLYSNLTNGECLLEWDNNNGFIDKSGVNKING
jgi:hypothetical protein